MLEGRNLAFRYSDKGNWLFKNLDISVAPGERVGLPGPSGRGKSTLAKVLAGYLDSPGGSVSVDGEICARGVFNPVQMLLQHPELAVNPRWRVKDILSEAGIPPAELLEKLQINEAWMKRYPHELSGGEMQRVCLARALDQRTRYLLCDEMTSMLDALTQASIWKTVLEIAEERQIGMLVISHDTMLLERICHRSVDAFSPHIARTPSKIFFEGFFHFYALFKREKADQDNQKDFSQLVRFYFWQILVFQAHYSLEYYRTNRATYPGQSRELTS